VYHIGRIRQIGALSLFTKSTYQHPNGFDIYKATSVPAMAEEAKNILRFTGINNSLTGYMKAFAADDNNFVVQEIDYATRLSDLANSKIASVEAWINAKYGGNFDPAKNATVRQYQDILNGLNEYLDPHQPVALRLLNAIEHRINTIRKIEGYDKAKLAHNPELETLIETYVSITGFNGGSFDSKLTHLSSFSKFLTLPDRYQPELMQYIMMSAKEAAAKAPEPISV